MPKGLIRIYGHRGPHNALLLRVMGWRVTGISLPVPVTKGSRFSDQPGTVMCFLKSLSKHERNISLSSELKEIPFGTISAIIVSTLLCVRMLT